MDPPNSKGYNRAPHIQTSLRFLKLTYPGTGGNFELGGGMAEWLKALVLKTRDRKVRGFESYSLRQISHCYWPRAWIK